MPDTISLICQNGRLQDLYEGFDAKDMTADQDLSDKVAEDLAKQWKSRLHDASAQDLATIISRYEVICEKLGRMTSFTDLAFAADMSELKQGGKQGSCARLKVRLARNWFLLNLSWRH